MEGAEGGTKVETKHWNKPAGALESTWLIEKFI